MSARLKISVADLDLLRWLHVLSKNGRVSAMTFLECLEHREVSERAGLRDGVVRLMDRGFVAHARQLSKTLNSEIWRITTRGKHLLLLKSGEFGNHEFSKFLNKSEQIVFWRFCKTHFPSASPELAFWWFVRYALLCQEAISTQINRFCYYRDIEGVDPLKLMDSWMAQKADEGRALKVGAR